MPVVVLSWETNNDSIGGGAFETGNESRMEDTVVESVSG